MIQQDSERVAQRNLLNPRPDIQVLYYCIIHHRLSLLSCSASFSLLITIRSSVCVEPETFSNLKVLVICFLINFSRLCVTITNKHHAPFYYHRQTSNGTKTKKQAYARYTYYYYKFSLSVYPTIPPPPQVSAWCRTKTKKTNTPKYRSKIKQATGHHLPTYLRIVEERCVTCSLFLYPVHICIYFNCAWNVHTHTRSAPTATTSMNTTTSPPRMS